MISICSVLLTSIKHYEEIFIESIVEKTKLVSEVIFAKNDSDESYYEEWEIRGIKFKKFGAKNHLLERHGNSCGNQHGLGLNFAISKTSNEYIYLCDPDIFFYSSADEFFYNLMKKYNLNIIGCSHHAATELSGTFFPWHGNLLVKKKDLPDDKWLANENPAKGKFLIAGLGILHKNLYPNPNGNFDTASGLWLYSHQQNWRWISFQTNCVHVYTKLFFRGNVKINEKFGRDKLIYHAVSGSIEKEKWLPYKKAYEGRNQN